MTARPPAPAVFEDPALPHQIRVDFDEAHGRIFVSCNCKRDETGRYEPLAEPADTLARAGAFTAYRAHLEEVSGS